MIFLLYFVKNIFHFWFLDIKTILPSWDISWSSGVYYPVYIVVNLIPWYLVKGFHVYVYMEYGSSFFFFFLMSLSGFSTSMMFYKLN